jgi:hypothetical protein
MEVSDFEFVRAITRRLARSKQTLALGTKEARLNLLKIEPGHFWFFAKSVVSG